ncbi:MAG: ribosome maturation factor RimM [Salinivirgaceae bacterium]|jgi:16S rRNA processing protein RimM
MQKEDCLLIGTIVKVHGIHGEVVLDTNNPDIIENIEESAFLEIEGLLVPFFIDDWVATSNERFRIKFMWTDSESAAKKMVGCSVYLPLKSIELNEAEFVLKPHLLIGFMASDVTDGELGEIIDIIDNPTNPLIVILKENIELLVPMHVDFIKEVQTVKKSVLFNLPKGLINLYL